MNLVFFFFMKTVKTRSDRIPMLIEEPRVPGKLFFYHYSTRPGYYLKRWSMYAKRKLIFKKLLPYLQLCINEDETI